MSEEVLEWMADRIKTVIAQANAAIHDLNEVLSWLEKAAEEPEAYPDYKREGEPVDDIKAFNEAVDQAEKFYREALLKAEADRKEAVAVATKVFRETLDRLGKISRV